MKTLNIYIRNRPLVFDITIDREVPLTYIYVDFQGDLGLDGSVSPDQTIYRTLGEVDALYGTTTSSDIDGYTTGTIESGDKIGITVV